MICKSIRCVWTLDGNAIRDMWYGWVYGTIVWMMLRRMFSNNHGFTTERSDCGFANKSLRENLLCTLCLHPKIYHHYLKRFRQESNAQKKEWMKNPSLFANAAKSKSLFPQSATFHSAHTVLLPLHYCLLSNSFFTKGPCLLFERFKKAGVERFFACSVCRDRKECSFYSRFDEKKPPSSTTQTLMRKLCHDHFQPKHILLFKRYFFSF